MSSNDDRLEGESDVFGVPTRIDPWALEEESSIAITWRRDLNETDLDPEDGEEKELYEWVRVASVASGGAWRAELRKGFRDTHMRDRPQLVQIDQAAHTDEGRERMIDAAIEFMLERGGEAEEETPDEDEIIAEVIAEEEAEEIGRWRRVTPPEFDTDRVDTVLVRWQDENDDIVVYVGRDVRDEEPKYSARAEPLTEDALIGNKSIKFSTESLETALDEAIRWMRYHRPGVPLPSFSMEIEGGIFKPLMELINRLGGGNALIEVRDDSVIFESASHVNSIDFRIPAADMESFEVEREGEASVDADLLWDAMKGVRFSDSVAVSLDASEDRPRLRVAGESDFVKWSVNYFRRSVPEITDWDAKATVDGLEYKNKINALRVIETDTAVFGVKDGVVFARVESDTPEEVASARLEATEVEGELLVLIDPDRLQALRRAMPRPSQTPITFTLKESLPMLAEYRVGETNVDVRIALKFGPMPVDMPIPAAEVTVPEDATVPEPADDDDAEAAMEEFAEAAAEEASAAADEGDEGDGRPETTQADVDDVVATLGGAISAAEARFERARELEIADGPTALRLQDALEDARERHENLSERPPGLPSTKPSVRDRLSRARGSAEALRERTEELRSAIALEEEEPAGGADEDTYTFDVVVRRGGPSGPRYAIDLGDGDPPEPFEGMSRGGIGDTQGEVHEAFEEEFGPASPDHFGETVGEVTFRGTEIEDVRLTVEPPEVPPEEEPEEERATISLRTIGGRLNYVVSGTPPGSVEDEAVSAAIDTLGQPGEFVEGIEVGEVRYRGSRVESIDFSPARQTEETDLGGERVEFNITVVEEDGELEFSFPSEQFEAFYSPEEVDRLEWIFERVTMDVLGVADQGVYEEGDVVAEGSFVPSEVDPDDLDRISGITNTPTVEFTASIGHEIRRERTKPIEVTVRKSGEVRLISEGTKNEGILGFDVEGGGVSKPLIEIKRRVFDHFDDFTVFDEGDLLATFTVSHDRIDGVEFEEPPEPEADDDEAAEPDEEFGRTIEGTFDEEVIEEGEVEEVIDEEPEEEPEEAVSSELTRTQIKEAVEAATVGTEASAQVIGSRLQEVKIRPSDDAAFGFTGGTTVVTTTAKETAAETVKAAIENWEQNVDLGRLTAEQREEVNEMRELIGERIGVDIPRLSVTVEPPTPDEEDVGFPMSEADIEEIINEAVEGANPVATITEAADSLRVRWEVPSGTGVRYTREPMEVQGAASDPVPVIVEALEEWQDAVALESVDREIINDRREDAEQEFGIDLPTVPRVDGTMPEDASLSGLAEQMRRINQDFETVPIQTEGLESVPGFDLPVQTDPGMAEMLDEDGRTSMEQALEVHHVEEVHDEVHAAIATVLDAEPENFYDSSKESDLPGFDLFYSFDMSRNSAPGAWTNRRFDPSTLFRILENFDSGKIQVVSRVAPLA